MYHFIIWGQAHTRELQILCVRLGVRVCVGVCSAYYALNYVVFMVQQIFFFVFFVLLCLRLFDLA